MIFKRISVIVIYESIFIFVKIIILTSSQSRQIYDILVTHFKNKDDAKKVVESIEKVIDERVDAKTDVFEKIVNKDIENLRQEMYKVFLIKEDKVDIIKWMVGMWVAQMAAIVFLIIKK